MLEKLTPKQIKLQAEIRDEWINIALHEKKFDKEECEQAIKWLYYASNLKEPRVEFVYGPNDFSKKFLDSVRDSVWASVRASVSYCCLSGDAEFGAWYEYWKKIGVYQEDKADKYVGYLRSGAFYVFFFEKVAFVMVRPTSVLQNDRKQLHSLTTPALTFQDGTEIYSIDGVTFDKEWWDKIANDRMTPDEIFAIDNVEHRRIAYQYMDKAKMKSLKDFKVLDEQIDTKGNPMKVISFTVQNMDEPLKFYNCICPSTGREYFLGTDETTCVKAKNKSFGLDDCEFINEW